MQYLNFDLHIASSTTQGYPLRADSELGQAPGICKLNVAAPDIKERLAAIAEEKTEPLPLLGEQLAQCLLADEIKELFLKTVGAAQGQKKTGVRVRLRIDPPELAALPWELMRLDTGPLAVSTTHVITRFIELKDVPMRDLAAPRPIRVLGIIPQGSGLDVAREKAALDKAVTKLGDALTLTWLEGIVTTDRVREALGEADYHVIHFIGHGQSKSGEANLQLNDDYGDECTVSAEESAGFFRNRDSVRLVVLNACQSATPSPTNNMTGVAQQTVGHGVPAVVAMQWEINDRVAQKFAQMFYQTLCIGLEAGEVDTAVTRARAALHDEYKGKREFATPILFLRAADGQLWHQAAEVPAAKRDQKTFGDTITIGNIGNRTAVAAGRGASAIVKSERRKRTKRSGSVGKN